MKILLIIALVIVAFAIYYEGYSQGRIDECKKIIDMFDEIFRDEKGNDK